MQGQNSSPSLALFKKKKKSFNVEYDIHSNSFWRESANFIPPSLSQGHTSIAQVSSLWRLGYNESARWGIYPDPSLCLFIPQEPNFSIEEIQRNNSVPQPDFPLRQENTLSKTIQPNNNSNRGAVTTSWIYITLPFQGDRELWRASLIRQARGLSSLLSSQETPWWLAWKHAYSSQNCPHPCFISREPPAPRVCARKLSEYVYGTVNVRCFPRLYF